MALTHSKYKNTGILYEILVRALTSDFLKGKENSPSLDLIKKYFVRTSLKEEYKLFKIILDSKGLTESKAAIILEEVLSQSKKFNRKYLNQLKYNLVKEIKANYNINNLLKTKIPNYKEYASLSILIESQNTSKVVDFTQLIKSKLTLLETITSPCSPSNNNNDTLLEDYKKLDKDIRILTYKILLEKFNSNYSNFNTNQKKVLRLLTSGIGDNKSLIEFYNKEIDNIKNILNNSHLSNKALNIKLQEVKKLLIPIENNKKIEDNNLVNLMQYYDLIDKLNNE